MIDFSDFELDHIGIAVNSIEEALPFYKNLGFQSHDVEEVLSEGVRVCFLKLKNNVNVELLEPLNESSPVAKFIHKRGTGIHHMCYRVKDIEKLLIEYKNKGIELINEKPKIGAHNCKIAFIHPRSSGGVLIELSERQ